MESEKIITKSTNYSINVAASKVDSLRITETSETVVRVYDNGFIGVAGKKGKSDEAALYEEAKEALKDCVPYPEMLDGNKTRSESARNVVVKPEDLVKTMKHLVSRLKDTYPDFIFSNKINIDDDFISYENSKNTSYDYSSYTLGISLAIKDKASANIMDAFYGADIKDKYDENAVVDDVGSVLSAFSNKIEMPEEELPIIIDPSVTSYIARHIIADLYMQGASLFNGKLGEKIFSDKFSIGVDHSVGNRRSVPFFDYEGTTLENDKFYFVKNGVLCGLVNCKRSAQKYNLPLSGCGYSDFTSIPSFALLGYTMDVTAPSLKELVGGKAIYIADTSGGDITADGVLGLPVQLAFLYDNGKLVGRLPEFSVGGSIYDVFGDDLKGVAKLDCFTADPDEKVMVTKFKINK